MSMSSGGGSSSMSVSSRGTPGAVISSSGTRIVSGSGALHSSMGMGGMHSAKMMAMGGGSLLSERGLIGSGGGSNSSYSETKTVNGQVVYDHQERNVNGQRVHDGTFIAPPGSAVVTNAPGLIQGFAPTTILSQGLSPGMVTSSLHSGGFNVHPQQQTYPVQHQMAPQLVTTETISTGHPGSTVLNGLVSGPATRVMTDYQGTPSTYDNNSMYERGISTGSVNSTTTSNSARTAELLQQLVAQQEALKAQKSVNQQMQEQQQNAQIESLLAQLKANQVVQQQQADIQSSINFDKGFAQEEGKVIEAAQSVESAEEQKIALLLAQLQASQAQQQALEQEQQAAIAHQEAVQQENADSNAALIAQLQAQLATQEQATKAAAQERDAAIAQVDINVSQQQLELLMDEVRSSIDELKSTQSTDNVVTNQREYILLGQLQDSLNSQIGTTVVSSNGCYLLDGQQTSMLSELQGLFAQQRAAGSLRISGGSQSAGSVSSSLGGLSLFGNAMIGGTAGHSSSSASSAKWINGQLVYDHADKTVDGVEVENRTFVAAGAQGIMAPGIPGAMLGGIPRMM